MKSRGRERKGAISRNVAEEDDISSQPNHRERVRQARESSADRHRGEIQLVCLRNIKKNYI